MSEHKNADGQAGQEVEPAACWCHVCNRNRKVDIGGLSVPFAATRMIVCPECGNKRCPHASDHELSCTNSNEPNQLGSVYNAPSQEGHAAGPACSAPEGEYVPLTAEQKQALNRAHLASARAVTPAPDEALIEEIAEETFKRWYDREFNQAEATKWAIREYIRRSAGKEKGCWKRLI